MPKEAVSNFMRTGYLSLNCDLQFLQTAQVAVDCLGMLSVRVVVVHLNHQHGLQELQYIRCD